MVDGSKRKFFMLTVTGPGAAVALAWLLLLDTCALLADDEEDDADDDGWPPPPHAAASNATTTNAASNPKERLKRCTTDPSPPHPLHF